VIRRHLAIAAAGLMASLESVPAAAQALHRAGTEFMVNAYTSESQSQPALAMNADGSFVVTWQSLLQDGYGVGVFARRFAAAGVPLGAEFQVNVYTTNYQSFPSIAADNDGDFVVAWSSDGQDGSDKGIFARRFTSAGAAVGGEFQVNTYTPSFQLDAAVAMDADGDFVVVWQSIGQEPSSYSVFARRFDSLGAAQGGEFKINSYSLGPQKFPAVAAMPDGRFVVAWASQQDGETYGVFARRFDSAGTGLASEFQVNAYTPLIQSNPAIAIRDDGSFVVVWRDVNKDGDEDGVFGRRFDSTGAAQGGDFQVNVYTPLHQRSQAVAFGDAGEFVVTWQGNTPGAYDFSLFARRFDAMGAPVGGELVVNTLTGYDERYPVISSRGGGSFLVVWDSGPHQDGSFYGVFGRRLTTATLPATLDIDGDGSTAALTDGLLVLRYVFGFRGQTLIAGAVGGGAQRDNAPEIEAYIASIFDQLDVDDNGAVEPLTDGLLILRYLFGFRGQTLIGGAVGAGANRDTAPEIEAYIAALV
jgi:hypothetical protein